MDVPSTPLKPEDLLAQVGWVRQLAGRLVVDPDLREDVAQQVMLVALEQRPLVLNPAAWLNRLVRNVAWQMNRSERARRGYERHAPLREPAAPVEDLVAEAELQRRIVAAVLALDEPYRSSLLQRFFRGRSAEEIAQREGVPAARVRSRLKRGLDQLRNRFGDEQRLNRGAWLALVLPAAGLEPAAAATAVTLTVGGVVMSVKTVVSGLAVIALIATAYVLSVPDGEPPESGAGKPSPEEKVASTAAENPPPVYEQKLLTSNSAGDAEPIDPVRRETEPASGTVLAGQVVDATSLEPVESFHLRVSLTTGLTGIQPEIRETVTEESVSAADGRFRLWLDRRGVYSLSVHTPQHVTAKLDDLQLESAEGITDLVVRLDAGRALMGVASGEYQLIVSARGYEQYVSEPFHYGSTFEKDLGRINLEPCGVFEFEVIDTSGQTITDSHIYLNDQILPAYRRIPLDGGRFSHADLPLGEVTLAAAADGYRTATITVTLEAGKPGKHRFVLEKTEG